MTAETGTSTGVAAVLRIAVALARHASPHSPTVELPSWAEGRRFDHLADALRRLGFTVAPIQAAGRRSPRIWREGKPVPAHTWVRDRFGNVEQVDPDAARGDLVLVPGSGTLVEVILPAHPEDQVPGGGPPEHRHRHLDGNYTGEHAHPCDDGTAWLHSHRAEDGMLAHPAPVAPLVDPDAEQLERLQLAIAHPAEFVARAPSEDDATWRARAVVTAGWRPGLQALALAPQGVGSPLCGLCGDTLREHGGVWEHNRCPNPGEAHTPIVQCSTCGRPIHPDSDRPRVYPHVDPALDASHSATPITAPVGEQIR